MHTHGHLDEKHYSNRHCQLRIVSLNRTQAKSKFIGLSVTQMPSSLPPSYKSLVAGTSPVNDEMNDYDSRVPERPVVGGLRGQEDLLRSRHWNTAAGPIGYGI